MSFAIDLVIRGGQAARNALVAIKDGVLGVASAERRLAADTAHAASQQDKLAASARKAHQELKAAASAMRQTSVASGVNPLTGGRSTVSFPSNPVTGIRRAQLLYDIQRSGRAGYDELAGRGGPGGGGGGGEGGTNHALARIGKRIGGIFGEKGVKIGESIGATPALGAVALGAVAASIALGEFGKAVQRAKDDVAHIEGIKTDIREGIRAAFASANAAALAEGKANKTAIASLIGAGKLEQGQALAKGLGAGGLQAEGTLNQHGLMGSDKVQQALRLAVGTGQITAEQFASTIGGARGLISGGSPEGIAKAVLARNGSPNVDVKAAGAAFGASKFGRAFGNVDAAEEHRSRAALARFAGGGTEGSIRDDASRIASPDAAARADIKRKLDESQEVLDKIAENQGAMARLWDAIANRGDSASNTRDRNKRVEAEAVNP